MSMGTQWLQHYIFIFIAGYRPTLHTSIWGFYCIVNIFDHEWADDTVIHMEGINEYGVLLIKVVWFIREAGYTIAIAKPHLERHLHKVLVIRESHDCGLTDFNGMESFVTNKEIIDRAFEIVTTN